MDLRHFVLLGLIAAAAIYVLIFRPDPKFDAYRRSGSTPRSKT